MRRSAGLLIPLTIILIYYVFWVSALGFLLLRFPAVIEFFPVGGLGQLAASSGGSFETVFSNVGHTVFSANGPVRLAIAGIGALILTIPVSWAYFITSRNSRIDQSFMQTIIILPVLVTGISMIVLNSLALAFSLAGVVAAVRFRFSLAQPSDAMYIFVGIGIGLGSGIGALDIAAVISILFVIGTLVIWKLEYGKTMSGPFLRMLTRRDAGDDEY
jgi:hypothetical protein